MTASISELILFRKLETSDFILVMPRANVQFLCRTVTWAIMHSRHLPCCARAAEETNLQDGLKVAIRCNLFDGPL